ncbi:SDR family oxidoreductase [Frankia sp. CNm7]|uniref:SDR family oxidoreductase n=1 Tax=Frankia nepalensis TaxID=1836974 RepID=A0A937RBR8_9ACTN|nr:SDR family oxidoreductase [Frankia nepalensis]MBL7497718.1 SDR family oxidoreductase [Frankia nepalensis]MBL7514173.1 SDR family oxidoreductase [Frankia nepalensis]MBL7523731.1 SDR family oxidoreductase [Frankia nepalensis]MBL7629181.1 SDR family oxidoreductase [Frankia nepalensis]
MSETEAEGAAGDSRGRANRGVAVVTGGGRGIGAVTAVELARYGWDVCLSYRADEEAAAGVLAACEEAGGRGVAVRGDVASADDVTALFAAADQLGPLTVLVNNAGIVDRRARVDEMSPERVERMLAVNVIGSFLCAGAAVRRMSTKYGGRGGAIVNVSSVAARLGGAGQYVDYAASKGAIDTMTIGLAREVAAEGIRVNAVRPGVIDTEIHASGGQPDRAAQLGPLIPVGRAGTAAEVAAAILWFCLPEASYATGALLDVSGGR